MKLIAESSRPRMARSVRAQHDPVTGEPLLLYPEGVLVLNATAQAVVAQCDGIRTVLEIVVALAEEYDVPQKDLEQDVLACLDDLLARNLLVLAT